MKNIMIILFILGLSLVAGAQEEISEGISLSPQDEAVEQAPSSYTWSDFLMGKSCEDDATILDQSGTFNKLKHTYCMGPIHAWEDLLITFRQNKKDLLINEKLKEGETILRYLKVIPLVFFDVHKTHPVGQTLQAQLDRIQNAIQNKDPEAVLLLMQDLLPAQQLFLMPLFNEAQRLTDFKNMLEKKGGSS